VPDPTASAAIAPLSLLDRLCHLLDDPERPLDFTLIHHLPVALPLAALEAGAASALHRHPVSGSRIAGATWRWAAAGGADVVRAGQGNPAANAAFLESPLLPTRDLPVRQLVCPDAAGGGQTLLSRFHHAACDGLGAHLWLAHQLAVAAGTLPAVSTPQPVAPLRLRRHPRPVRRNRFAPRGPSRALTTGAAKPGPRRGWLTLSRPAWRPSPDGLSESDALATSFLAALVDREAALGRAAHGSSPLGLWMPLDLRRPPGVGFGNATSRVRVYARWSPDTPILEACAILRRQRAAALRAGEWGLPERLPFAFFPGAVRRRLIRLYARRPWVDMGSAVFTHLARSPLAGTDEARPPGWPGPLPAIDRAESIGPLDRRHPLGLGCVTHGRTTFLTFTHDPAALDAGDVARIAGRVGVHLDALEAARARGAAA
jgi:hypothetical protein